MGRAAARDLRARCGTDDPAALAAALGIRVMDEEGDGGFGSVVVFADYTPRPPTVRLFRPAIAALDARLAAYPEALPAGSRPVFLAHELFHHWEELHPEKALLRRFRDRRLPELAAGAFAQELLGLKHHPAALDRLVTPGEDKDPSLRSG